MTIETEEQLLESAENVILGMDQQKVHYVSGALANYVLQTGVEIHLPSNFEPVTWGNGLATIAILAMQVYEGEHKELGEAARKIRGDNT